MILRVISLLFITTSAVAVTVRIKCDGTSHSQPFKELFSLDIKLEEQSQVHLSRGKKPKVTSIARIRVLDKHGSLSPHKPVLKATLDLNCSLVEKLECELNGYLFDKDYKKIHFKPHIHFDATIRNGNIQHHKGTWMQDAVSLVTCSADVGMNNTVWSWQKQTPGDTEYQRADPRNVQVFPSELTQCTYHTVSRLIYINNQSGQTSLRCKIGDTVVGTIRATTGSDETDYNNEVALSTMLFLSTIILVYPHFIFLPCVFGKWDKVFNYRENDLMLKWRTCISYMIGVAFLICCAVTCSIYRECVRMNSYLAFAIIEWFFIMAYATMRFISKYFQNANMLNDERKGLLNNARVSTSFGAVLVPLIGWIFIKIQGGVGIPVLEAVYYVITSFSILSFVCVSFGREGKYWDEKLT